MSERMSKRDVLEKVREHFSRPGSQMAYDVESSQCLYRMDHLSSSPVRCAMGVCIPDRLYSPDFEETNAAELFHIEKAIRELFEQDMDMPEFLNEVQAAHDDAAGSCHEEGAGRPVMFEALAEIEDRYGLV